MKKSFKGIITAFLCLAMTCPTACAEQQNSSSGKPSAPAKDYTVWATNTYEKFKQDDFSKVKEGAVQVNIEAVKNEYESAQLLISTSDDISSYYLEKSDLTCGENTILAANVQVYNVL